MRLLGPAPEVHLPRKCPVPTMGHKAKRTVHHRGGVNKRGPQANLAEMNEVSVDLKPLYHRLEGTVK